MILIFATREQIDAYNQAIGAPSSITEKPDGNRYTTIELEQADLRSNIHMRIHWYNNFKPEFQANTLEELPQQVRDAMQEAVSIGAGLELLTPKIFSATINPAKGAQLKRTAAGTEFFEQKGETTTTQVNNSRGQDGDIHDLLDKFLINPNIPANKNDTCAGGETAGYGLIAIGGGRC